VRPSRALPYDLYADIETDAHRGTVKLEFVNKGEAGAVFHVYDKLHLDAVPRRYVVEPRRSLRGNWDVSADGGKYDLWVLGPNGFHRHFAGDLSRLEERRAPAPEVEFAPDGRSGNVRVTVRNDGDREVRCMVRLNKAYGDLPVHGGQFDARRDGSWTADIRPGRKAEMTIKLRDSGNWYDLLVTAESDPSFVRRMAGRIETGRHTVSDPAMGISDNF
jgi:phospholipase C